MNHTAAHLNGKIWELNRQQSHMHAVEHAKSRGIDLDLTDIERIEDTVKSMTAAFDRPDTSLHFIVTHYKGFRFVVLFDTVLQYIVSIGVARPLVSEPRWRQLHRQEEDARP